MQHQCFGVAGDTEAFHFLAVKGFVHPLTLSDKRRPRQQYADTHHFVVGGVLLRAGAAGCLFGAHFETASNFAVTTFGHTTSVPLAKYSCSLLSLNVAGKEVLSLTL